MQDSHIELQAHAQSQASTSRSDDKPIPTKFACAPTLRFAYSGSPDGIDTNLLILLHGRGDSEVPFAKLADTLHLPQTATLALRGPLTVPLLDEDEREWWNESDMMGMSVSNPNPSAAIELLCKIIGELEQAPYGWSLNSTHLFGFGQGGTLACETALQLSKSGQMDRELGSVVSIQGPLLSLPPQSAKPGSTKILFVCRAKTAVTSAKTKAGISALERAFASVKILRLSEKSGMATAMPDSRAEWEGIMAFWSEHLQSSTSWQRQGEVYEVTGSQNNRSLPEHLATSQTSTLTANAQNAAASSTINTSSPSFGISKATPKAPTGLKRGFLSRGL